MLTKTISVMVQSWQWKHNSLVQEAAEEVVEVLPVYHLTDFLNPETIEIS